MSATGSKKQIIIALIVGLVIVGAILIFWILSGDEIRPGMTEPDTASAMTDAKTVPARIETVTEWYTAVGTVQPRTQARIEAQVSGQVTDVRVNAGVIQDAARQRAADAEHVGKRSFDALLVGDFDA